jgi:hypothetical protein
MSLAMFVMASTGLVVFFATKSNAGQRVVRSAIPAFQIFAPAAQTPLPPQLVPLVSGLPGGYDQARVRVGTQGLGRYHSKVWMIPSTSGAFVCYALTGATTSDPSMGYCYPPNDPNQPSDWIGKHFNGVAFYSALDGIPSVQVFGVAFDDVTNVNVEVDGQIVPAALANNTFYLDLPGKTREDVSEISATLQNGSVQTEAVLH